MQRNEPSYSERQRFRQWWLWTLVLISPAGSLWAIFQQIILGSPFGNNLTNDLYLTILALIFGVGFPMFMYATGLDTEVRESGILIRFWPFHRQWVVFGFDSIEKAEAHSYSPLRDYGGWGIRYGGNGKAYNVSGNKGVLIMLKDGKNVLIGSQNHEDLCSAINERLSLG